MSETKNMSRVHILVECALMIAIGTVLMMVKIYELPNGGSVTLVSMLPFVLVSFRHGPKWGMITGLACALLQMMTGWYAPPAGTVLAYFGMIMLDYIVAFTMLGTACVFAKPFKNRMAGVVVGTAVVCLIRFLCSFLSGFLIWGSIVTDGMGAVIYSLGYNASYMVPETILTTLTAAVLFKVAPALFGSAE
ncbi:energy-coupled thiamine transporter ThiT [Butyricicoccus sp. Marseille-Q5471]|uniref:energy-coupled thiamine transporter ThiT n=1 Tax=Butyricicoccus sp. Marseille-Q5471 TaxID=3039493 RepID=UPI0024BC2351|nr:energy-coupled thiamine transporter ThiT [Butyricicoccus sp. Marseille-Q5471]